MKNQFFGDNKDLFTYDLILKVISKIDAITHLAIIPMLTENDGTGHGNKVSRNKAKAGTDNKELIAFLDECVNQDRRDIRQLEGFFAKHAIETTIYCGKGEYFSHERRKRYFQDIGSELLSKSLIFIDPDTGFWVKKSGKEHVLYSEVKSLYERMGKNSILMIYQYLPRRPRQEYLNMRAEEIKEQVVGDYPICIDDDRIAFFFLTKDEALEHSLLHIIGHYAEHYS